MKQANLDPARNFWYEIFDHNDPEKTHVNWSLLEESKRDEPWFPLGEVCTDVIPKTVPGSIAIAEDVKMQSFSIPMTAPAPPQASSTTVSTAPPLPPAPVLPPSTEPVVGAIPLVSAKGELVLEPGSIGDIAAHALIALTATTTTNILDVSLIHTYQSTQSAHKLISYCMSYDSLYTNRLS